MLKKMNECQDASLAECVNPSELEPQELEAGTDYPQAMYSYHPELFQGESLESQAQLDLTLHRREG